MSIECVGVVLTDAISGAPQCHDGSGAVVAWTVVPPFDPSQIDAPTALGAFSAAFVMVGTAWAIGFGVRTVLSQIRR